MEYKDEEILRKREEIKKQKYQTLENGVYLDGKIMQFERVEPLNEFSVLMPDVMRLMPKDYARIKYPSEFRPKSIWTTLDLSVNMGFSILLQVLESSDMKLIADRMAAAIHRSNSDYRIYPIHGLKENSGSWFAIRSHAMDSDLYNMILVMPVKGRLLQCNFNCLYREYMKWKNTVVMMWESIEPTRRYE